MRLIFNFLFFALLCFELNAQNFEREIKSALKEKPRLEIKLDSRNSFISSSRVRVFGLKMGVVYDEKISFGIGYNFLFPSLDDRIVNYKNSGVRAELFYRYWSPYLEYVFYEDKRWQLSIPVQFGIGSSFYKTDTPGASEVILKKTVMSYEPAITFQYRFLDYFGAGMGIGYRLMIVPNNTIEERFTSPVFLFKFKIYFQDFYHDLIQR